MLIFMKHSENLLPSRYLRLGIAPNYEKGARNRWVNAVLAETVDCKFEWPFREINFNPQEADPKR